MRAYREASITGSNTIAGYQHGPLVQQETQSWTYGGVILHQQVVLLLLILTHTLVLWNDKQTLAVCLESINQNGKYVMGNGMRMTRAFGCPVRTLRNASTVVEIGGVMATRKGYCID